MQGTLKEIDVATLFRLIEYGQRTGEMLVESSTGQFWFVFFLNGNILYATDPQGNLSRLSDYLHGFGLARALEQTIASQASLSAIEYGQIWKLLEGRFLSTQQAIAMVDRMVEEVLFDLIGLYRGNFTFESSTVLAPQLISRKFSAIADKLLQEFQDWRGFSPQIQSPEQCPVALVVEAIPELSNWIDGKTSLRQLSRYSRRSLLSIARTVYAAIERGEVKIAPAPMPAYRQSRQQAPRIVCIDDSVTICRAVEYILHSSGYQVTAISNPVKALSLVFQLKPELIFCDIDMPELDGYELCAMFRKSSAFSHTPIVMLTGKDGFVDRVKARMVGATAYLTKPFGEKELLTTVEKYLTGSQVQQNKLGYVT